MTPQLFNFKGNQVRTVTIDNEPYFVGKDVADILGYKKPENAIANHVDDEDKTSTLIQGTGSNYKSKAVIINESGLYSLILGSKLPQAKEFKHWITNDVLPTIRKHGAYMTPEKIEEVLLNPDTVINLASQLKQEREQRKQLQQENNSMKPKALFADAVTVSNNDILIGQLAKILRQNGYNTGQNRLFKWMRNHHYLCIKGQRYNQPTQKAMEAGLFKIHERTVTNPDGSTRITITTKVTGKGQQHFINRFLGSEPNQLALKIESA